MTYTCKEKLQNRTGVGQKHADDGQIRGNMDIKVPDCTLQTRGWHGKGAGQHICERTGQRTKPVARLWVWALGAEEDRNTLKDKTRDNSVMTFYLTGQSRRKADRTDTTR